MTSLRQGPIPIPTSPLGAVDTLSPPHQPLQPHPFLSPSCPPAWIFPKQSATQHTIHNPLHTNSVKGKQPPLPCESWAVGQRQENSSTNRHITRAAGSGLQLCTLKVGLPMWGRLQEGPGVGQGTNSMCLGSLNLGQTWDP